MYLVSIMKQWCSTLEHVQGTQGASICIQCLLAWTACDTAAAEHGMLQELQHTIFRSRSITSRHTALVLLTR
jgi:hypothetical protein